MPSLGWSLLLLFAASFTFASSTLLRPPAPTVCADDCSLNGDCVNGACVCDAAWSGSPSCDVLSLLPANKLGGYHNSTNQSTWGGLPQYSAVDGLWHMAVAQLLSNCSLWEWKNNSAIAHVVSNQPGGPYVYREQILPPFAHNPKLYPAPGGGWVLFAIGGGLWNPMRESCAAPGDGSSGRVREARLSSWRHGLLDDPSSPTGDGCGPEPPLNGGCGITVSFASSLSGPWDTTPLLIVDQNRSALLDCAHTNPSVAFFANGSALMAFNAGYCHNSVETIGLAIAPSWRGPWTLLVTEPIFKDADGTPHSCEDPELWMDSRGYHLMVHDQSGGGVSAYAHAVDPRGPWSLHSTIVGPYNGTVAWTDGSVTHTDVQRPQLVLDPQTGKPIYLVNGAFWGPTGGGISYTLFRPVRQ